VVKRFFIIWLGLSLFLFIGSIVTGEMPENFGQAYGILYIWLLWMLPIACLIELGINLYRKRKQK
jgi:hypothetical protein